MSEFSLHSAYDQPAHLRPGHAQQTEWYQGGGTYDTNDYSYKDNGAGAFGSFDEEPPLLEELGIDVPGIIKKSRSILLGRWKSGDLKDLDLGGPLIFAAILGSIHLLMGRLHFGVILGWGVVTSTAVWFVLTSMAGRDSPDAKAVDLYSTTCLLGYCQLPMVLFAFASLLIPRGALSTGLAGLLTLWCAWLAGKLIVRRVPHLSDCFALITYPCLLVYAAFALLSIY